MDRTRPIAVVLGLVLVLAACGGASGDAGSAGTPPVVPAVYDWSAQTVDGGEIDLAALADGPVVLWMWAPWCSVCNREAPEVAGLLAELPDDVTLVGVAGRDDVAPMREFVARHGLQDMVHAVDVDGSLWARYGVSYQPAWVFLTPDGRAAVAAGALGRDGVLAALDEVLGA